jgi:tetratricopeptide (TPR) repeat protein
MTAPGFTLPRGVLLALATAVAVVLGWRVLVAGIDALSTQSAAPGARGSRPPRGTAEPDAAARQRLARNPADAAAMLSLALELERQDRREEADAAMRAVLRLAPTDSQTLVQVAGYFLRIGEEPQALATLRRAADVAHGGLNDTVSRVFLAALDTGRHRGFFDGVARDNPPWWPEFFRRACEAAASAGAVAGVLTARGDAGVASADEWRCLIGRLQREGQWVRAHQLWLNSLPLDQRQQVGYVFNGGFELPMSNTGFDWTVPIQDGVTVSTGPGDGTTGRYALNVTFVNKRYGEPPIRQYLMLSSGRHRLEGRVRSDLDSWLGLQWGIYCHDRSGREPRQLARTERFAVAADWSGFGAEFVVPKDCPVQLLRLELANPKRDGAAPGAVAVRLKGTAWFDDLRIRILD